jgi:hypothetical protein
VRAVEEQADRDLLFERGERAIECVPDVKAEAFLRHVDVAEMQGKERGAQIVHDTDDRATRGERASPSNTSRSAEQVEVGGTEYFDHRRKIGRSTLAPRAVRHSAKPCASNRPSKSALLR